jgi:hypothetical protein
VQQRNRASNDVSLGSGSGETWDYKSVTYRLCAANVSKKKKTRPQLISSLPPSTRNTVPARWSDTGSKVACREISIIVLHASCGGARLMLAFQASLFQDNKSTTSATSRSFFNARELRMPEIVPICMHPDDLPLLVPSDCMRLLLERSVRRLESL